MGRIGSLPPAQASVLVVHAHFRTCRSLFPLQCSNSLTKFYNRSTSMSENNIDDAKDEKACSRLWRGQMLCALQRLALNLNLHIIS